MAAAHSLHVLRGGAKLITAPMPERESTSIVLMFAAGSRYEEGRLAGVSHFIEHLLFKGTTRRPSSKEIAEAIEGVGGTINAATDKELTAFWTRVPAERMELGLDVLFDIVSNSKLDPAEVEKERAVILEELKSYHDQPQDYVQSLFEELIWPDHPLGRDITGTRRSVSQLTRDDILEYADSFYRLPNLVIGVAGSIDVAKAVDMVGSRLTLPADLDGVTASEPPASLSGSHLAIRRRRTEQAHICLGMRAYSYHHPDRFALELLNAVLGEGMSSRLFMNIRERLGLAYDVHSFTQRHKDTGYIGVYLGVDPQKAVQATRAVVEELQRLCEEEVPVEELTRVKEFNKGRLRLDLENTGMVNYWLCQQQVLSGEIVTLDEELATLDAVTPGDVRRVALDVLRSPIQLAAIGPFSDEAAFRTAIGA